MEQIQLQQLVLLTSVLNLPDKIKVNCAICNKELYKYRCRFLKSEKDKFYCSKKCAARESKNRATVVNRREEYRYKYDRFFHCSGCGDRGGKWIPKENAKWHKTKQLTQPRCPECNTLLSQRSRNAKFKKNNNNK